MAGKIALTPELLLDQSNELRGIQNEFASLFSEISSELQSVNANWSENLANNFLGKLSGAQREMNNIIGLLDAGVQAAQNAANAFCNVDGELQKIIGGGFTNHISQVIHQAIDNPMKSIDVIAKHENGGISIDIESARKIWESMKDTKKAYGTFNDFFSAITGTEGEMPEFLKTIGHLSNYEKILTEDVLSDEWVKGVLKESGLKEIFRKSGSLTKSDAGIVLDVAINGVNNVKNSTVEAVKGFKELAVDPETNLLDYLKVAGSYVVGLGTAGAKSFGQMIGEKIDGVGDALTFSGIDINGLVKKNTDGRADSLSGVFPAYWEIVTEGVASIGVDGMIQAHKDALAQMASGAAEWVGGMVSNTSAWWSNNLGSVFK